MSRSGLGCVRSQSVQPRAEQSSIWHEEEHATGIDSQHWDHDSGAECLPPGYPGIAEQELSSLIQVQPSLLFPLMPTWFREDHPRPRFRSTSHWTDCSFSWSGQMQQLPGEMQVPPYWRQKLGATQLHCGGVRAPEGN
ncbi:hypothetical protein CB1_000568058 [Camelus ferus]|nr:hypothetical protein CB1_000568058 [Camelus ferus]